MIRKSENIDRALRDYGRAKDAGEPDVLLIKRTDHPHVDGDYFYTITQAEKTRWTPGETVLTQDEIADLWYAADCSSF